MVGYYHSHRMNGVERGMVWSGEVECGVAWRGVHMNECEDWYGYGGVNIGVSSKRTECRVEHCLWYIRNGAPVLINTPVILLNEARFVIFVSLCVFCFTVCMFSY